MSEDTINILIGAAIAFVTGVFMPYVLRWIDKRGKIDVYCKLVANPLNHSWGISERTRLLYWHHSDVH